MKQTSLIKKAILSEKGYKQMEKGVYTFLVDESATKEDIKRIIKDQFSVQVKKVNMAKFAPKRKKIAKSRKTTLSGGGKKAIVWLAPGQEITMLVSKKETGSQKQRPKGAKEKDTDKVSVEGKEV